MGRRCGGSFLFAVALVVALSGVALALPGFSDRNVAAGNLNPTDRILVQQVRITGDSAKASTIGSATVQNLGTAGSGQLEKIEIYDGATALGETTNLSGLTTAGVTVNLGGYAIPAGTTHEIRLYVTVGATVAGGETLSLRIKFYYQMDGTSYTSAWISDLTGETIRKGGFDATADTALDATFFNPDDSSEVQVSTFTDNDANGNNVFWEQTGSGKILEVENLGTAKTSDLAWIRVTLTIDGDEYVTWDGALEWITWSPASPMPLNYDQFVAVSDYVTLLPASVPDNSTLTVKVEMWIEVATSVTDGRTIRTRVRVFVKEGEPGDEASYEQTVNASTTQTIRKQGYERIVDESVHVASGTKTGGEYLEQAIKLTDDDVNASDVQLLQVNVRNAGTAGGAELHSIKIMRGSTKLAEIIGLPGLASFKTGLTIALGPLPPATADDGSLTIKIYYNLNTATLVDEHTLQPVVKVQAQEPAGGTVYWSDEVTYPDVIALYAPGLEVVENLTPPEGGTAYSGQRFLAQLIRCEDLDENDDGVTIHPVVVKNLGTAQENPDIAKIEVVRRDTLDGTELPMGQATTLTGLRTSGVAIPTQTNNTVTDAADGAEVFLAIYVTVADPEQMVAGRTIQLVTRVLHTEAGVSYDKEATSNQWTLAVNHRPVPNFTFAKATTAAAVGPLADFTYQDTIQFNGTATDADGDAITSWHWDFDDGTTSDVRNPTHSFPNGGTFDVTLTVTDARGVTGSVTKTITVEGPPNVAPTVVIAFTPTAPNINQNVTFTATVTDPDQPAGTEFTYEWDFGDGSAKSNAKSPVHPFPEKKSYTVTVKVTDTRSGEGTATKTVVIGNDPPTIGGITVAPTSPATGEEATFTATGVTDPNGDTIAGYNWTFGDDGRSDQASPKHTYFAPGTYTVTLVVTDSRGSDSAEKTLTVTVTGPSQVVVAAFPNPATTEATIRYQLPAGVTEPLLRVFDLSGALVYERDLAAGESTFVWNLTGSGGALPKGLYFLFLTAKDAEGKAIKADVFKLLVQ
jgi:PKD repeat protein